MKTTIIIPVKDHLPYTKKCLCSIANNTNAEHDIIVVDDGSMAETRDFLQGLAGITLISNKESRGFPASCNLGMARVKSDFFVIMNNDVLVTKNWLNELLGSMRTDPKLGILGPVTNYASGPQKDCCVFYRSAAGLENYAEKVRARKAPRLEHWPRIVFFCVLIRTSVYQSIGGLDERFGVGNYDDDDFCLRALVDGWKCAIDRHVFIHHYGSKTYKKNREQFRDLLFRNKKIFLNKWNIVKFYLDNLI